MMLRVYRVLRFMCTYIVRCYVINFYYVFIYLCSTQLLLHLQLAVLLLNYILAILFRKCLVRVVKFHRISCSCVNFHNATVWKINTIIIQYSKLQYNWPTWIKMILQLHVFEILRTLYNYKCNTIRYKLLLVPSLC